MLDILLLATARNPYRITLRVNGGKNVAIVTITALLFEDFEYWPEIGERVEGVFDDVVNEM